MGKSKVNVHVRRCWQRRGWMWVVVWWKRMIESEGGKTGTAYFFLFGLGNERWRGAVGKVWWLGVACWEREEDAEDRFVWVRV